MSNPWSVTHHVGTNHVPYSHALLVRASPNTLISGMAALRRINVCLMQITSPHIRDYIQFDPFHSLDIVAATDQAMSQIGRNAVYLTRDIWLPRSVHVIILGYKSLILKGRRSDGSAPRITQLCDMQIDSLFWLKPGASLYLEHLIMKLNGPQPPVTTFVLAQFRVDRPVDGDRNAQLQEAMEEANEDWLRNRPTTNSNFVELPLVTEVGVVLMDPMPLVFFVPMPI